MYCAALHLYGSTNPLDGNAHAAQVRFMVRQPMIIDDSTADDMDDDQLELVEGAAAAGQATVSGAPQGGAIEIKKSVRLAADGKRGSTYIGQACQPVWSVTSVAPTYLIKCTMRLHSGVKAGYPAKGCDQGFIHVSALHCR